MPVKAVLTRISTARYSNSNISRSRTLNIYTYDHNLQVVFTDLKPTNCEQRMHQKLEQTQL